jgi:hypothetical protein
MYPKGERQIREGRLFFCRYCSHEYEYQEGQKGHGCKAQKGLAAKEDPPLKSSRATKGGKTVPAPVPSEAEVKN